MLLTKESVADILDRFDMVDSPKPGLVSILRETTPAPNSTLVLCTYGRHRYLILQDSSSQDQASLTAIFEDGLLIPSTGHLVENPLSNTDGNNYAVIAGDKAYYLWSYDKDE